MYRRCLDFKHKYFGGLVRVVEEGNIISTESRNLFLRRSIMYIGFGQGDKCESWIGPQPLSG